MKNKLIGITGTLCSGKSSVAMILQEQGVKVFSSDVFLYEAYKNPFCLSELVASFGDQILDVQGELDRVLLKLYLREHPEDCQTLWDITDRYVDPKVEIALQNILVTSSSPEGAIENAIFESSQLYVKGWDRFFSAVIGCSAPEPVRIDRLVKRAQERDGFVLQKEEAQAVLAQQNLSDQEIISRVDFVVWNSGDRESLRKQTLDIYRVILYQQEEVEKL